MKINRIILFALSFLLLTGCTSAPDRKENDKMQVYTSFYAMYDFAKQIGDGAADIHLLCPVGTEPHDFEPKTSDMAKLTEADVFIYNGMGMESWTEDVIKTLKNPIIVEASKDIPYIAENYDPHVWLNPQNALKQMENIKDAFCERDSKNADTYEENFRECEMKINELCDKYNEASQEFSDRNIIVAHAAYGYLCDAFNLNQTPIEGMHGEGGASPARMAEVVNFIRDNDVKYIFATSLESGKTMETIAKETDTQILVLNPFEGDTDGKDYFSVMEENLISLKKALN